MSRTSNYSHVCGFKPIHGFLFYLTKIILTGIVVGCAVMLYDEIKTLGERLKLKSKKTESKDKD